VALGVPPACSEKDATHQLAGETPAFPGAVSYQLTAGTAALPGYSPLRGGKSNVTLPLSSITR
jgi:hypothetical protein